MVPLTMNHQYISRPEILNNSPILIQFSLQVGFLPPITSSSHHQPHSRLKQTHCIKTIGRNDLSDKTDTVGLFITTSAPHNMPHIFSFVSSVEYVGVYKH